MIRPSGVTYSDVFQLLPMSRRSVYVPDRPAAGKSIPGCSRKGQAMVRHVAPDRWKRVERIVLLVALVVDEAAKLITALHR